MKYFLLVIFFVFSVHGNEIQFKNFDLPLFEKQERLSSQEAKGEKLVINFFASWCTACIKELPELRELKSKNSTHYQFIAINAGEEEKIIKKFLNRYDFPYKILIDKNREYSKSIGVNELPHTLIIDESGNIIYSNKLPPTQKIMDEIHEKG